MVELLVVGRTCRTELGFFVRTFLTGKDSGRCAKVVGEVPVRQPKDVDRITQVIDGDEDWCHRRDGDHPL
jgi:hypothetical protein